MTDAFGSETDSSCSRLYPSDESGLASDRSEVRNADPRAMMTGYAEVTFERRQHLDLARQHRALDLPTWVNRKPVLPVYALSRPRGA